VSGDAVQLLLLRHADAGDSEAWTGDDAERPLSGKGRRQARWTGRWLGGGSRRPNVVVTSPKVRAAETAAIATADWELQPHVDGRLGSGFDLEALAGVLADHAAGARRVMLVGHDPDFSDLAFELTGGRVALKKGAVARIDLELPPRAGGGVLRWLVPAEALSED
jgi:phosphohistidine phosphatase